MKTHLIRFLMLNMFLAFAEGCDTTPNSQLSTLHTPLFTAFTTDSLFESTGNARLDSMLFVAATAPRDTNLANLYNDIGRMYRTTNFENAKEYLMKSKVLSEELDWNQGRYMYSYSFSLILLNERLADSVLIVAENGYELAKKEKNETWIGKMSYIIGNAYKVKEWYETALTYYMEAITIFERLNNQNQLYAIYVQMGQLYSKMNVLDKHIEYSEKALLIEPESPYAMYNLGKAYSDANQYEKANNYYEEALRICTLQNNHDLMSAIYVLMSDNAIYQYELEKAEMYCRRAMKILQEIGSSSMDYYTFFVLGKVEMLRGNFDLSEKYVKESLQSADELGATTHTISCYRLFCELAIAQSKNRDYLRYSEQVGRAENALALGVSLRAAAEMGAKYETEKKEIKITALEEERRLMTGLSIAAGIILLLALITSLSLWRWAVQKRSLAEQQVKQLEQEKQLIATQAVLDGETQERTRLARDLHDGLGGILAGTKLNLQEMKKGVTMDNNSLERYAAALGLLDQSVREMRRVAHHLMPDALSRFGLKAAIGDFCNTLSCVNFAWYGNETRLVGKLEEMLYRITHELVTNAMKHSGAEHIFVQIISESDRITLTVQDNGCGFDPSTVLQGMGLTNIRNRIAAYNGSLMVDTKIGVGTEINVEMQL